MGTRGMQRKIFIGPRPFTFAFSLPSTSRVTLSDRLLLSPLACTLSPWRTFHPWPAGFLLLDNLPANALVLRSFNPKGFPGRVAGGRSSIAGGCRRTRLKSSAASTHCNCRKVPLPSLPPFLSPFSPFCSSTPTREQPQEYYTNG